MPPERSSLLLTWNWGCTLDGVSLLVIIRRDYLIGFIIFEVPNSGVCGLVLLMNVFICGLLGASPTTTEV